MFFRSSPGHRRARRSARRPMSHRPAAGRGRCRGPPRARRAPQSRRRSRRSARRPAPANRKTRPRRRSARSRRSSR
ncbi:MAG: hypothetical protein FJX36_10135 [Alphaproteobacteria bacterium]|nr:hypothetical protein [Alphaproteobacteria bacterium]